MSKRKSGWATRPQISRLPAGFAAETEQANPVLAYRTEMGRTIYITNALKGVNSKLHIAGVISNLLFLLLRLHRRQRKCDPLQSCAKVGRPISSPHELSPIK